MAEKYNTTDLQQLIEIKTKEAENAQNAGAPKDAVDKMWAEVEQLKQQQQKEIVDSKYAGMNPQQKLLAQANARMFEKDTKKQKALEDSIKETLTPKIETPYVNKQQELIETSKEQMTDEINTQARKNDIKSVNDDSEKSDTDTNIGGVTTTTTPETTTTTTTEGGNGNGSQNPPTPPQKEGRYKSSMYGILDAMRNGDIDKSTGLYFMLDALSKAARNTGIDIGNIGAQFSGGTVRDDYQDSLWNQRKNKMFENEVTSELNKQEGTDKEMQYAQGTEDLTGKKLANEATDMSLEASRTFNRKAEDFRKAGNDVLADLYSLVGSAATREIGPEEIIAIASSPVLGSPEGQQAVTELVGAATNLVKAGADTFGGLGTIIEALTNPKEFMQKRMGDK